MVSWLEMTVSQLKATILQHDTTNFQVQGILAQQGREFHSLRLQKYGKGLDQTTFFRSFIPNLHREV